MDWIRNTGPEWKGAFDYIIIMICKCKLCLPITTYQTVHIHNNLCSPPPPFQPFCDKFATRFYNKNNNNNTDR